MAAAFASSNRLPMNPTLSLRHLALALSLVALAACGDDPSTTSDCDLAACIANAPAVMCSEDGESVLRPTQASGCDETGECTYVFSTEPCPNGCQDGVCLGRCSDVQCVEPAEPRCSDNTLVTRVLPGAVEDFATCECEYETERTDCGDDVCFDGECRPFDCSFISCDEAPEDTCEGDVAVDYPEVGQCDEDARDCAYDAVRTDCAEQGTVCVEGACVDTCGDVICDRPPAASCDGDVAVIPDSTGTCDAGSCRYEITRQDCSEIGASCSRGACVPLCEDAACIDPPDDTCDGTVAVTYPLIGACNESFECGYAATRTDCAASGLACVDGDCVEDPGCDGIVCSTPPGDYCEGDIAHEPADIGVCLPGPVCSYPEVETDCSAIAGSVCALGQCELYCDVNVCVEPPADYCDGNNAVYYSGVGACSNEDRSCSYSEFTQNCTTLGERCVDGACVGDCVPSDCDEPPAPFCIGDTIYEYEPIGFCNEIDACDYDFERGEDCGDSGMGCLDGACVALCDGETCDTPPEPNCVDRVAYNYEEIGACVADECEYTPLTVDCELTDQFCGVSEEAGAFCRPCIGAECLGPCDGVVCDEPSGDTGCDDDVAFSEFADGECVDGSCVYPVDTLDCQIIGATCTGGLCSYSCEGVTCARPAATCDGTVLIEPSAGGAVCDGDDCYFDLVETDCLTFGRLCSGGACADVGPICDTYTCDEAGPICDGDTVVTRSGEGVCDPGPPTTCDYTGVETRVPCTGSNGCFDGACVRVPQPGEILITEIVYDPTGVDTDMEWFELYNNSGSSLSLESLTVTTSNGSFAPGDISIGSGAYLLIASSASAVAGADADYAYFRMPIRNDADTLALMRGDVVVDAVAFDVGAGWPDASGVALSLDIDAYDPVDNDDPAAWCAETPNPGSWTSCD